MIIDLNSFFAAGLRRNLIPLFRTGFAALLFCAALVIAQPTLGQAITATITDAALHGIAINPITNKIYIADSSGTLTVVDGLTNASTTLPQTGAEYWAVAVNPITNMVYVVDRINDRVDVFAGATATAPAHFVTSVSPGGGNNLFAIAVNPVNNKIYACDDGSGLVWIIDGNSNTMITTLSSGPPPNSLPASVAVNPITGLVYVVNSSGTGNPGSVAVIDGTTNALASFGSHPNPVTVGNYPQGVAINTVLNRIYVPSQDANTVAVIDGPSNTVVLTLSDSLAAAPSGIAVNSTTNQIYVSNLGNSETSVYTDNGGGTFSLHQVTTTPAGYAVTVDTSTNYAWVTSPLGSGGNGAVTLIEPISFATLQIDTPSQTRVVGVNPVTHKVYAGDEGGTGLTVIDAATNTITGTFSTSNSPSAIALNPVTNVIYVMNGANSNHSVDVLSPDPAVCTPNPTPCQLANVVVGTAPAAMTVDPVNNLIYVANSGNSTITVIDGRNNQTSTITLLDDSSNPTISPDSIAYNPVLNQVVGASNASNVGFVFSSGFGDRPIGTSSYDMLFGSAHPVAVATNPAIGVYYTLFQQNESLFISNGVTPFGGFLTSVCTDAKAMDVNPVTNSVYVACFDGSTGTVNVDVGSNGFTGGSVLSPIVNTFGVNPWAVAVNPATNKVYAIDNANAQLFVINGATNSSADTVILPVGASPVSVAVNVATDKIYVLSQGTAGKPTITIVDGATNKVVGTTPVAGTATNSTDSGIAQLAINPATGNVFAVNLLPGTPNATTQLTENLAASNSIVTTINNLPVIQNLPPNSTDTTSPTFTFSALNNFTASHAVTGIYFQVDSQQGSWSAAKIISGTYTGVAPNLAPGFHILYAYATDGEDSASANEGLFGSQDYPLVGTIAAYGFLVDPPIASTNVDPGLFGSVPTGSTSSVFNPILINDGASPLNYSFEITGPNSSDFTVNPTFNSGFAPCPTPSGTLAPSSVCAVNIFFSPTTVGSESATLTFLDDSLAVQNSTQSVGLQGSGFEATVFSGLSPSQAISTTTTSIFVFGTISSGGNFPIGQTVTVTINGTNHNMTVFGGGTFGMSIPVGVLSPGQYPIAYSFIGSGGFGDASDSTSTLTVTSYGSPAIANVKLLGTGNGTVADDQSEITNCQDTNGNTTGICTAAYMSGTLVTFTATANGSSTFGGWGGDCAFAGTSSTCQITDSSSLSITASFIPQSVPVPLNFVPNTTVSGMATFDCQSRGNNPGPGNPCTDSNAHSLAISVPKVNSPFTLYVTATEFPPADGNCPNGSSLVGITDFDCRFATFFTYATQGNSDRTVPLCIPYANGNCVFYTVNTGTPGTEPDPLSYSGAVNWQVSWNNDLFVPPSPYTGSTPRLYEDPDGPLAPPAAYGTNCNAGMIVVGAPNAEPYACQFEFDVTTSYDPTKPVDATVGGKTKQFSDVVVAYPPANLGQLTVTSQPDQAAPAPGSPLGITISIFNSTEGAATNVVLNDPLPAGGGINWAISPTYTTPGSCSITGAVGSQVLSCTIGTLNPTDTATVRVASASSSSGTITNAATVSADDQQVLSVATITVTPPTPTFKSLTPSQAIVAGTTSITLTGTVSFAPNVFPANGEQFPVSIGSPQVAAGVAVIGSNGTFSATILTSSIPTSSTPYDILYSYGGDANLAAATDSSTSLLVTSFVPASVSAKLLGTGTGSVSDDQNELYCAENAGIGFGTCVAAYDPSVTPTVNFTATPDASSSTTFGGWGGSCASFGNGPTCSLTVVANTQYSVIANFLPPAAMKNIAFPPSDTTTTKMATFDCTMNVDPSPENPCIDPNAHSIALTIPQVITPFTMTVVATEFAPTDGNCPAGSALIQVNMPMDFDCRFAIFFGATQGNGDRTVPLCDPYANGNCIHYQIYFGTPGTEPPQSAYAGDVNWTISWNNDQYVPPAPYSQSTPRLFEDPDGPKDATSPYGSDCTQGMTVDTPPSPKNYACQFEFDITTSYDPTKKVDATVGGKTKQFSDVVVAFPPAEFTSLTPSQAITQGAAPITLSGNVGVGSSFPSLGETVTISINGVTQTTTISGSNGAFSTPFDASSIPSSPVPYPITYSYAGDPTLEPASDSSTTLTVNGSALETTTTMVTSSPSNPAYGDPITLTVTVDPPSVPTGSVQATIDGAKFGAPVQLTPGGNGTSTCPSNAACATIGPITTLGSGTHTIIVTYIPTGNFMTSFFTISSFYVSGASVTPSVTANNKVYDGTTTATIATCTLSGVQSADVGNVTCSAAGPNTFADKNVANAKTVTATGITLGGSAKANYQLSSTTATTTASITARATSVAVGLSPNSVTVGTGSTVTVTVSDTSAPPTFGPGGTIVLSSSDVGGSGDTFSACTLSNANPAVCTATVTTHEVGASPHTITATYSSSDGIHTGSNGSSPLTVTAVAQAATTVAVTSSANPSVFGQSVTFTATITVVAPGTGHPASGENVTFKDGVNTLGTGLTNGSGVATFSTPSLSVASHSITAVYPGDANYTGNTSPAITQVVNKASTSTALISSANPSVFGQSVTFTATITTVLPGAGLPASGETVTFKDGATTLGTGLTNGSGVATFSTATLSVASHSATAVYAGDGNFGTSTSSPLTEVVNKAATTTTITSSLTTATVVGQAYAVAYHVTVNAPGGGTIPGSDTVTVSDGSATCTATVTAGTCQLTSTTPGVKTITAKFGGDSSYAGSSSTGVSHTVNQAPTINSANTATFTQGTLGSFTVTATGFPATFAFTETGSLPNGVTLSTAGLLSGTPTASGSFPITITASNGISPNGTQSFTLKVNAAAGSALKFSPATLDFGTVYAGSFTLRSTTITNTGTSMVTFTKFSVASISGDDSSGFVGVDFCPKTLNAGKSCTIIMSFTADSNVTKTHAANLVVTDTAPGSPQTILMSATVINPGASVSPSSINFGTEKVNSINTKPVTLTNSGTTALNISSIAITGSNAADFQTSACGSTLAPGGHCTITVTFKPLSKSSFSASLTITDNALSGKQTVSLSGKGN